MTLEEYKQLMSDYGFSVVEDNLAVNGLYYVAFYGNSSDSVWHNVFAVCETDKGVVKSYTKLYYEQSQGICVVYDKKIVTKDIEELRPIVIYRDEMDYTEMTKIMDDAFETIIENYK